MNQYIPELGQGIFAVNTRGHVVPLLVLAALRLIDDELNRIMWNIYQKPYDSPFYNTGNQFKCDEFEVQSYDWSEDREQRYNFKWKNIEISWYKYLGRGMSANIELDPEMVSNMLDSCLSYLWNYEQENESEI